MKKTEPKSEKKPGTSRQPEKDVPESAESTADISRIEAARLATFPQLNRNPIAEADFAGQIHYVNPAAERLFPNLRQLGIGHPWLVDWESSVRNLRTGGTNVIVREVRVSGCWCQQTLQLVKETQRILIYGVDVTERVLAEEALRNSEARYRKLFMDSSAPMLLIDPATAELVDANPAACRYYGHTHTELKKKKITDINTLTSKQIFEEMKRIKAGEPRRFEFLHRLASGEIHPVEVFSGPIELEGRVLLFSILHDITEQKQADEALRKSEERFRQLANSTFEGILIHDKGVILDVNQALTRLTGYDYEEAIGKSVFIFIAPESREVVLQRMQNPSVAPIEISLIKKDGTPCLMEVAARDITYEGKAAKVIALRDITERKRAEKELIRRQALLEEANKELESFSYSVSHDLRAPLRAIDGYARMLLKKHGHEFDEDSLRKFNVIRSSTHMMGQLIDDLLAFSRLSRKNISRSKIDMEALIGDVWKEVQADTADRNINLTVNSMPSGYGDRALIKQVYMNLLSNAVKFTKFRDPALIEVGGYVDGNDDVYYVKDNGVGFDMTYYDKLFGVFQRLHKADEFEGTGIGLATVQRMINRHGGRVWAEGNVDKGATFYFSLPPPQTHSVSATPLSAQIVKMM